MDILILAPMISTAILFLTVATRLWKSSISSTIQAVTVAIAVYCYPSWEPEVTLGILFVGVFINMLRGVVNTDKDSFIKRSVSV